MPFSLDNLQVYQKCVPLQCVFHSIRFKVNKGWSTAVLLFFAHHRVHTNSAPAPYQLHVFSML